jgi:geranylgeranyl pyrophosphate synthase
MRRQLAEWFSTLPGWQFSPNGASSSGGETRRRLESLKREAIRHGVPAYCRKVADRFLNRARAALDPFPDSVYKSALLALTRYLLR